MKLYALSDLHVNHAANRRTLEELPPHPDDWLVLAGDIGESDKHLRWVLELLTPRWGRIVWVPGNHELWSTGDGPHGEAKYQHLVGICREYGALTPEDPYPHWPDDPDLVIVPMFLLYDYSFGPVGLSTAEIVAWAAESGIQCADERFLRPDPFPTREAWCEARLGSTAARLAALPEGTRTILINHWPLRRDLVRLFRIPRFIPWCGTRKTEDWHLRWRAELVVSGHLHVRATDWRDGVRFEEVSLGYPRHWRDELGAPGYLRQVWPAPSPAPHDTRYAGPFWHP